MLGDIEVDLASAVLHQEEEDEEHREGRGRRCEEIDGGRRGQLL